MHAIEDDIFFLIDFGSSFSIQSISEHYYESWKASMVFLEEALAIDTII